VDHRARPVQLVVRPQFLHGRVSAAVGQHSSPDTALTGVLRRTSFTARVVGHFDPLLKLYADPTSAAYVLARLPAAFQQPGAAAAAAEPGFPIP
jgi:hypothetical protein